MSILLALHLLAAVVWVGGMFFAYMALRPAAGGLAPRERLELWQRVFDRFLYWVWAAVVLLLVTGYWMVLGPLGGFEGLGLHIQIMHGLGWVMVLLFLHLFVCALPRPARRACRRGRADGGPPPRTHPDHRRHQPDIGTDRGGGGRGRPIRGLTTPPPDRRHGGSTLAANML